ncbi:MAG: ABC transporter ATP-binding protein, partial [Vicinamibacterales bacterium]
AGGGVRTEKPEKTDGSTSSARSKPRKLSYNEQRELAALPKKIAAFEAEQKALHEEAASETFYRSSADRINEVLARIDAVQAELDVALERWIALQEIDVGR